MSKQLERMKTILEETFPNSSIPQKIYTLKMGDIREWDSLGNFNLLLAIETEFDMRFSIEQISEIRSVKQIIEVFQNNYD